MIVLLFGAAIMLPQPQEVAAATCVPSEAGHRSQPPPSHETTIGWSVGGRPIEATTVGSGPDVTLVLGGVHGDEPASPFVVDHLIAYLRAGCSALAGHTAVLVARVNPDGVTRRTRVNALGVDLNRNLPTRDWTARARAPRYNPGPFPGSAPETQALMRLVARTHPCKIITIHAPYHQLNIDGPALALARVMAQYDHYPITTSIGYPTPGSLGDYAGKERGIPTITLELPPLPGTTAWVQNRRALLAAIGFRAPCVR